MPSKRELRRKKRENPYVPRQGERVTVPSYLDNIHEEDDRFEAYVVDVSRPQGVIGATVRYLDKQFHNLPDGGMHWWPARDMKPILRGGASYISARPEPSRGRLFVNTEPDEEETSPELTTIRRRRRRRTSSTTAKARRRSMAAAATTRTAEDAGTSAEHKTSLQRAGEAGKLPAGRKRRSDQPQPRRTKMSPAARRTRRTAAAEPEPETTTTTRKRGRKTAKAEPEPEEPKTNGARRTHEDIVALVPEIVKKLKDGTTMTEIRAEYGAGPVIRKALTEQGYNTKGEQIERPDLTELEGKELADAVAELRQEGKAWYYLELCSDMSQNDLKDLLEENGYGELAEGRVLISGAEEEEEEAPTPKTRKRGRKAQAEEEEEAPAATTTRRRGRKAAESAPESEPAAASGGRRRGRRQAANPS